MTATRHDPLVVTSPPAYLRLKLFVHTWTLLSAVFAIGISSMIIGYIGVNHLPRRHSRKFSRVPLLLTGNTCLAIICSSTTQILMTLSTIGGDCDIAALQRLASWKCRTRGYLHFVFINAIYLSYVLQAGYRLFRIAFRRCSCLRKLHIFSLYILIQWSISFLLIMPVLVANEEYTSLIEYLPAERFCQVPMTSVRGTVFSILTVYFVPLCCLGAIYLWIILYIQRHNRPFALLIRSIQHRNRRDTIIIKRICVVMIILLALGVPSCLFVIAFVITGRLHWTSYRIGWMTVSLSFALISVASVYVTPQIYKPVRLLLLSSSTTNPQTRSDSSSNLNNVELRRKSRKSLPTLGDVT